MPELSAPKGTARKILVFTPFLLGLLAWALFWHSLGKITPPRMAPSNAEIILQRLSKIDGAVPAALLSGLQNGHGISYAEYQAVVRNANLRCQILAKAPGGLRDNLVSPCKEAVVLTEPTPSNER